MLKYINYFYSDSDSKQSSVIIYEITRVQRLRYELYRSTIQSGMDLKSKMDIPQGELADFDTLDEGIKWATDT